MGPHIPKILVADDNVVVLKTVSIKLKSAGYSPRTAMDGSTAISCVRRERPILIILDIHFSSRPHARRWHFVERLLILDWLRRIDEVRETPIIFITSGESSKFREKALAAPGANGFFQKKMIDQEEMLSIIRHTVGDPPTGTLAISPAGLSRFPPSGVQRPVVGCLDVSGNTSAQRIRWIESCDFLIPDG